MPIFAFIMEFSYFSYQSMFQNFQEIGFWIVWVHYPTSIIGDT